MFRFLDSLEPAMQAWVRVQKPQDFRAAMQAVEKLGSTLAMVVSYKHRNDNRSNQF